MVTMTATKMLSYANRRLVPGEDFETKSDRDMKVLLATRKAKVKRAPADVPPPPPEVATRIAEATAPPPGEVELIEARLEYKRVTGKQAYHAWDAATLREKIAIAGS